MSEPSPKTAAEKLAEAVRRKTEADRNKGGGSPERDAGARGASLGATQSLRSTVSKRSGSFKGR